jgi:hypothetical protein
MRRKSWPLWLVAAACGGPFVLAALLYFGPFDLAALPRLPGSRVLIEPPVMLPPGVRPEPKAADGPAPWALIYLEMGSCEESDCLATLERLAAVRLALGQDLERVQRVFVYARELPGVAEEGLDFVALDVQRDIEWMRAVDVQKHSGHVIIADPLGNLVAAYPPEVPQKELLRDLKRLLSVSQIG